MVVVDNLLERAYLHWAAAQFIDLRPLFQSLVLSNRFQSLLILHELLLQQEVVLDALELEQLQSASCIRIDSRQLLSGVGTSALLPAHSSRQGWLELLWLVLLLVLVSSRRWTSTWC